MAMRVLDLAPLEALLEGPCEAGSLDSRARWGLVSRLVGEAAWDKAAGQWMAYAEEVLGASCLDRDRVWPHAWARRKKPLAAERLARHLFLGEQSAATHEAMMARFARLDAAQLPPLTELTIKRGKIVARRAPEGDLSAEDAAALVGALAHVPLRVVRLRGTTRAMWEALAASALPGRLERLELELGVHGALGVEEELELAAGLLEACGPLREVSLSWSWRSGHHYSARLWAALLRHTPTLEAATLRDVDDDAQVGALCEAAWPALTRLELVGRAAAAADEVAGLLSRAPRLTTLRLHRLGGAAGAGEDGGGLSALEALEIALEGEDGAGLEWLLRRRALSRLKRLSFKQPAASGDGLWAAVCALPLELLSVGCREDATAGGGALVRALCARPVETLAVLTLPCDALEMLTQLALPSLRRLGVRCLVFEEAAMEALAASALAEQLGGELHVAVRYTVVAHTEYKDGVRLKRFAPRIVAQMV